MHNTSGLSFPSYANKLHTILSLRLANCKVKQIYNMLKKKFNYSNLSLGAVILSE